MTLRDDLRGLQPYGAPQLNVRVRLNTNENPYPPPPALVHDVTQSVAAAAAGLNRYPDRDATELRASLAGYLGLDATQVWAANGSNELIQQLLQAFGGAGRTALGFEPSYTMHRLIARSTATQWVSVDRAADFSLSADLIADRQPDVVFVCSPNNPTGNSVDLDVVAEICEQSRGMVIVDEAYAEFSSKPSAITLLDRYPRLVVLRTMSKAFAFAGGRLGYLAADPSVVDALQLVRLPYHLSALTQAAATAALRHADETLAQVAEIRASRDALSSRLREELGLEVVESDANFLLFGRFDDERKVWHGLLDQEVLIRDVGLPGWLRVSIGTPDECALFFDALQQVVNR